MAINLGISEILKECSKISGTGHREKKITYLQSNSHAALKAVLGFCFDPKIKWMLPKGVPPYTPSHLDLDEARLQLYADFRKLHIFVESVEYHTLNKKKRELLFIEFLENLHPEDAELVCSIKDGEMPYPGITKKLAEQAFPNMSKNW
jgi:hypothetical protein